MVEWVEAVSAAEGVTWRPSRPTTWWWAPARPAWPSAYYGVGSTPLGGDRIDATGPNAGGYERADAPEICAYYRRVLEDRLLGSGRVRFLGMSDYVRDRSNGHTVMSRLTGGATQVRVRRKLVDATYLEGEIPSRHALPFDVGEGVRVVPPNDLVERSAWDGSVDGYTVLGAGKTAMDVCNWLLGQGVPPESIRWVRPRDAWTYDRELLQPRELVASVIEGSRSRWRRPPTRRTSQSCSSASRAAAGSSASTRRSSPRCSAARP